jgi:Glycosyl hydrolases family 16
MSGVPGERLDRSQFVLEFDESFQTPTLNRDHWLPHYLPQWSSRERSVARYEIRDEQLSLRIDDDQAPWCPEFDGALRVSNLQTGVFSGPVGSAHGQHRFRDDLVVREAQDSERFYTPHFGLVEARVKAIPDARCMVALWMIGFEDIPSRSAELCVFEIFGSGMSAHRAKVGLGVHPFGDPTITDEFHTIELAMDASQFHTYSVEWMPGRSLFYIDDVRVARMEQAPDYPLQLMLNVFEFPSENHDDAGSYPKEFIVDFVRGYHPRTEVTQVVGIGSR